ncbi:tumor necrosis factor ligand superfamily member 13B isoform X3 [Syngnathoides biaculeatus]|uniref:tumor necrosis factor ligand superfamily member 13B isoform X3 n=1 Tax=Syngnathoides biaculeatus TaxID=300417 RepID=UPI002ADD4935|nr:tumor necrosis factor ligand superfamily member 13B isoform X3 [Syngnathoides biaculeatus]
MAVCSRPGPGTGQKAGEARGPSRPVFLLTLAVITSSSLSALSLYQLVVLREEVEGLKSEACRRREDGQEGKHGEQNVSDGRGGQTDPQHTFSLMRRRRMASGTDSSDSLSCLQLLANKSRKIFRKDFALEPYTGIPWQTGLRKGSALETLGDNILIRQEGFYFVYSQVYYMDSRFAMGHVVIRRKRTVVGDEAQHVILFRCIQSMDSMYPYNTCYTGGVVKLEVGDQLELLIPRSAANVSLDGDSTFLGAIKLV